MPSHRLITATAVSLAFTVVAHAAQPVELASGSPPNQPQQPQVAVDEAGGIHVAWGLGDTIRYCRSTDGGRHFSPPVEAGTIKSMSLGLRRGPRIAATSGFVCITAIGSKFKGGDGDLVAFRSTDGGRTWQGPSAVSDEPAAAREGLHAMAVGPKGELCCVWLDLRDSGPKGVAAAISTDGGATWGKNAHVYHSPDGPVCPCCHPSVTFDDRGGIYVMWRNSLAGNRDMYVCQSADGGRTFGEAAKLGAGTWPLKTCPMDGGAVAAVSPDKLATIWRREKSIYLTVPGDAQEKLLGPGEQPWIAANKAGPFAVWVEKRGEKLLLLPPGAKEPQTLANHAADPVIATALSGNGPVVAVWEARESGRHSIQCKVISAK
jgi:hypothetical protein